MKTGLVSVSFRALSPDEIIDLTLKAGLDCIEWGGDVHVPVGDIALAQEIGARTRAAGLENACYGSYYRLTDAENGMAEKVVATAKALGAPLIRVWAGRLGSAESDAENRAMIIRNMRRLADMAAKEQIATAFEWHGGTLTDTTDSALELLHAIDHPNVGTLWQPPVNLSIENCTDGIRRAAPYIRNIHVFSWNGTQRLALADGAEKWHACLDEIRKLPGEHRLMMEFVRDDSPTQFFEDAACLARWSKGEWNS